MKFLRIRGKGVGFWVLEDIGDLRSLSREGDRIGGGLSYE